MSSLAKFAALGSAALLAVTAPTDAEAATGTFHYWHAYTKLPVKISNPADNICHQATGKQVTGQLVVNNTSHEATLYSLPGCAGEALGTLSPGQSVPNVAAFGSVKFTAVAP